MNIYCNIFNFIVGATPAYAQDPFKGVTSEFYKYYTNLIVPVGIVLAVVVIVYAGIVYASSQGQPDKLGLAKELIVGALIGLLILLSAGWIVAQVVG